MTYPFPNFNGCTVEVLEWISNSIPHFAVQVIAYPCWDYSQSIIVNRAPDPSTKSTPFIMWPEEYILMCYQITHLGCRCATL